MNTSPASHNRATRSVIICAYTMDRWQQLAAAVDSVVPQLSAGDQLIVVIDHNPDLLTKAEHAFSHQATVVANGEARGLSGARNTGVAAATGSLVLFLDDDARAEEDWVQQLSDPFAEADVVGVGGYAQPDWSSGTAPAWMPSEFLWVVGCSYVGLPTERAPIRNPIGCNMAFRRQSVLGVGGFSSDLGRVGTKPVGGEETDLSIRIVDHEGGRIMFQPEARVLHTVDDSRETWRYFVRRCYFEGRSKAVLARRVGPGNATSAERTYLSTLGAGVLSRVGSTIRDRSVDPLRQIGALAIGLAATGAGFVVGTAGHRATKR